MVMAYNILRDATVQVANPLKQKVNNYFLSRASNGAKVFKNGPSEICGRQPLKNLK